MVRPLIDNRLLGSLSDFYPQVCTVQYGTETRDAFGEPITTWASVVGLENLACRIAPSSANRQREIERDAQTITIATHRIGLRGYYPTIIPKMRVVSDSKTYDILLIEVDAQHESTYLDCEVVT